MKSYLIKFLFVLLVFNLSSRTVFAFEEHAAHVHGHATLMLVQEKNELQMVFKSPAINIVGFEHQPNSPEQIAKVEAAESLLKESEKLFQISEGAKCHLEHSHVKSALLSQDGHEAHHGHGKHHENKHHDHEGDHKKSHGHKHDHHEHKHHSHEKHHKPSHGDSHDHHKHHADKHHADSHNEDAHSEFEVEYHFECANMDALKEMKLGLFEMFPSLEEVEAQLILKTVQRLQEIDSKNTSIKF